LGLFIGYDKNEDVYEMGGSDARKLHITDVNRLRVDQISGSSGVHNLGLPKFLDVGSADAASTITLHGGTAGVAETDIVNNTGKFSIENNYNHDFGDIELRTYSFNNAILIDNSKQGVAIGGTTPGNSKLKVFGNIESTTDITASGNIYAKGDIIAQRYVVSSSVTNVTTLAQSGSTIFGDTPADDRHQFTGSVFITGSELTLQSVDPRIRLKAIGANHPGIEWHEDTTRKWIQFNDPANDHMTWKNASDTELMELDQDGELYVNGKIYHLGDTDTFINFTTDDINIQAGGVNMMDFTQNDASQDEITFNEAGADLDVRIEGDTDANLLFTNAGTDRVGIGTNSPNEKLGVQGNISASGTIIGKQYHYTHHNFAGVVNRMFLPFNSTADDDSVPSHTAGYQRRMIVPYDGELKKLLIRAENAPGNTSGSMWKAGDAAAMSQASVSDTVNMSAANTTYTLTFSSGNTFSAGDVISIAIDPTNDVDDAQATAVWLYTVSG